MIYSQINVHIERKYHFIKYPDSSRAGTSIGYAGGWTSYNGRTKERYSLYLEVIYA